MPRFPAVHVGVPDRLLLDARALCHNFDSIDRRLAEDVVEAAHT
jgi:hypothetical protein